MLGEFSFALVTIGALAQPTIGPGTQLGYLATVGTLAWFLVMAGVLAALARRPTHRHAA